MGTTPVPTDARAHEADGPALPAIDGAVCRAFDPSRDYPAIAELIAVANIHDGVEDAPTADIIRNDWTEYLDFDACRDAVVVETDATLIGVCRVATLERSDNVSHSIQVVVAPDRRRHGVGSALLGWAEAHAREQVRMARGGRDDLPHFLTGWHDIDSPGAEEFAYAHGYAIRRHFLTMVRDLAQPIPEIPLPLGLDVRPVRESDHRRIWDADVEAFRDHFDATVKTEQDYVAFFSSPYLDTSRWEVAWDGDEVAGLVVVAVVPEENERLGVSRGWLQHVAVRRAWRGRGLASALVASSLRTLRDEGLAEAALGVDAENGTGALQVYAKLGFVTHRRDATFRKPL